MPWAQAPSRRRIHALQLTSLNRTVPDRRPFGTTAPLQMASGAQLDAEGHEIRRLSSLVRQRHEACVDHRVWAADAELRITGEFSGKDSRVYTMKDERNLNQTRRLSLMRQALAALPTAVVLTVLPQLGCAGSASDRLGPDGASSPAVDASDIDAPSELDASDIDAPPAIDAPPELDASRDVADDAPVPIPTCLQDLIATCPLEGACQAWMNDGGAAGAPVQRLCYESGMRVIIREDPPVSFCGLLKQTTEVRRADGTLCYTKTVEYINHCEGRAYEWRDAAGNPVASGSFVRAGGGLPPYLYSIQCAATSETASCMEPYLMSASCLSFPPNPGGCAVGDCQ